MLMRTLVAVCALLLYEDGPKTQDGGQWKRHVIAEGFVSQTAVAADFTGDGLADVIASDITAKDEKVILFVAPDWKPVVLNRGIRTIHFAVIDVNGDGKPDVV